VNRPAPGPAWLRGFTLYSPLDFFGFSSVIVQALELCDGAKRDQDCGQESTVLVLGVHPAMNEADIWHIAHELIRDYGADAESCARLRAEKLQEQGIPDDAGDWLRIADAVAKLQRGSDDRLN
jgi:hypothetical protein